MADVVKADALPGWWLLDPVGITEEETAKVQELKGLVEGNFELSEEEGKMCHPPWLLRFLRARQGNVQNAEVMVSACIEWKREIDFYSIKALVEANHSPAMQCIRQYWPSGLHGVDNRNVAVFYGRSVHRGSSVPALYQT